MKTIIAALVLMTTTAFADHAMPIMTMTTQTVLRIDQVNKEIRSINVTDIGTVIVVPRNSRKLEIFQLSATNKNEVLSQVKYLSDAELVTVQHAAVCEMMTDPNFERSVLVMDSQRQLREVLSPEGCMYVTSTFPKSEYQIQVARDLKSRMISLVLQQLNQ